MRLLIATPLYPPEPGGPATYAKLLEEGLPGLGMDVHVVKFSSVRRLPKLIRHFAYFFRLLREGKHADVLFVLDPVSTGLPAAFASIMLRKPLVLKVVGDYAWEQGRQRFGVQGSLDDFVCTSRVPFVVGVLRNIQTWVASRARLVVVPSEYLKKIVSTWDISAETIVVVSNAISLEKEGRVPDAVSQLPHPRVVTVARLVPWKGIDKLINAVADVRASSTNASLIVIGEGPERARLEKHLKQKLPDSAILTGALPPKEVHAILRESDIFVLNSTYEGLSHVLIESLMTGLPTIATKAGGNAEVITEGSGLLIPVGDQDALVASIKKLAEDPEFRAMIRKKALKRSEEFTVPKMLSRTHAILTNL